MPSNFPLLAASSVAAESASHGVHRRPCSAISSKSPLGAPSPRRPHSAASTKVTFERRPLSAATSRESSTSPQLPSQISRHASPRSAVSPSRNKAGLCFGDGGAALSGALRATERGDSLSLTQVLQCLASIRDTQVVAWGGSELLWVASVLRAAIDHLEEESDMKQKLEAEVSSLRERAMQLDRAIQAKYEELWKAEETVARNLKQHVEKKQDLEETAKQLRHELAQVVAEMADLNWQESEGFLIEREAWEDERRRLQEEIHQLGKDIEDKTYRMEVEIVELTRQQQEKKVKQEQRVKEFMPGSKENSNYAKKNVSLEKTMTELSHTLEAIESKIESRRRKNAKKGRQAGKGLPQRAEIHQITISKPPSQEDEASVGCNVSSCNASVVGSDEDP